MGHLPPADEAVDLGLLFSDGIDAVLYKCSEAICALLGRQAIRS